MDKLGVVFGGPSPEHDVSVLTGLQAARELLTANIAKSVTGIYWSTAGEWFEVDPELEAASFADGVPSGAAALRVVASPGGGFVGRAALGRERALGLDAVVNACHGGPGEDGTLAAMFDLAGITYAGPSVAGAALGMDKWAFGAVVASAGMPTLPRELLTTDGDPPFPGPYIVKPRFGGSSIGIDVVEDWGTATARLGSNPHLRRGAIVEPYRPDLFDLNVAVTVFPAPACSAIERPLRQSAGGEILGYADKYIGGEGMVSAPRELPAEVDGDVAERVYEITAQVAELCMVRGVSRVDFLSDGTGVFVNEINTIPGSLSKHLWVDPPRPFSQLLADMLEEAHRRPAASYSSAGADGTVLCMAGSIAGKLG